MSCVKNQYEFIVKDSPNFKGHFIKFKVHV